MKQKVYFLSGTMCDERLWQYVFPKLPNIDAVYVDINPANSFEEINGVIDTAIKGPAILVGFSLGGFAALNFTLQNPEKVKKLAIIAADAYGLDDDEIALRKGAILFLKTQAYKGISKARIKQFLHPLNHNKAIIGLIKQMDIDLGKETLLRQLGATSTRVPLEKGLSGLKTPILLVASIEDGMISLENMKKMKEQLPNAQLKEVANSGHMIPLEQPEKLAKLLMAWM